MLEQQVPFGASDAAGEHFLLTGFGASLGRQSLAPVDEAVGIPRFLLSEKLRRSSEPFTLGEGQLKRREIYVADERKSEACFAKDGSVVPYYPYEVMPVFERGGNEEIVRAIQLNTHYPVQALRNQEQGRVFVSFEVSEVGKVENVRIVKGVSASLDAETIAAVDKLKVFTPGRLDGEPVSVSFTLPITYMIR